MAEETPAAKLPQLVVYAAGVYAFFIAHDYLQVREGDPTGNAGKTQARSESRPMATTAHARLQLRPPVLRPLAPTTGVDLPPSRVQLPSIHDPIRVCVMHNLPLVRDRDTRHQDVWS